jgi:catechol 2,3-dioxygenase-like lactoylglutathione lyase family enzyme
MEASMLKNVHHMSFTVSDLNRSLAFYRDRLGMEVVVERDVQTGYMKDLMGFSPLHLRLVFLRLGDTLLELIQYLNPKGTAVDTTKNNPGIAHICFLVDDIHAAYEHLVSEGVRVQSEPVAITFGPNKGGFALYVFDPDGIPLELLQTPNQ